MSATPAREELEASDGVEARAGAWCTGAARPLGCMAWFMAWRHFQCYGTVHGSTWRGLWRGAPGRGALVSMQGSMLISDDP
jgi:hypothetical protein